MLYVFGRTASTLSIDKKLNERGPPFFKRSADAPAELTLEIVFFDEQSPAITKESTINVSLLLI